MKLFKINFIIALLGLLAALALPTVANAQIAGIYPTLATTSIPTNGNGVALIFPTGTTNQTISVFYTNGVANGVLTTNQYGLPGTATNLVIQIYNYDYVGLTLSLIGTATSTNDVLIYKSFDQGRIFEATPSFSYTGIAPGNGVTYSTNASLDVHGVTTLAFVVKSYGTTSTTNNGVELNLKSAQIFTLPPGNYGKTPGTPISVPNFGP